ncbi:hypothetical protein [Actinocrispum sp. NPDC049592]|uniref:hypothetical protein n=1 Tax=Actinocrispum sp. NPDC049592 TaxID=3154835 RepID=UPI003420557D
MSGPVEVPSTMQGGCCVARPEGVLDSRTYRELRDALIKLAVEQPDALVVDLHDLRISSQSALTVFSSVWMRVSEWPGVPILLVTEDEHVRSQLRGTISRYVPDYPTVAAALAKSGLPPARRRAVLELAADPDSSHMARLFVWETCERWELYDLTTDALAVVNELVDNVNAHTHSGGCQVRLELRRRMLTIAVCDESPAPAVLRERIGFEPWGNGLRIVAGLSRHWGCTPHLNDGKVVWAVLGQP